MKGLIFAIIFFIISIFASGTAVSAEPTENCNHLAFSTAASPDNGIQKSVILKTFNEQPPYTYIRVLIEGHWWTFVYDADGSFIVAIPDEDE